MAAFWGPEFIDQVRNANDILDVIQSYVPLKRAGASWKALSPFKKERTPSFIVTPAKQIWYCFSTNQGGDVFRFVQLYENVDFPSAVRLLARRANIPVPDRGMAANGSSGPSSALKDQIYDVLEQAAAWWHSILMKSEAGASSRAYLKSRAISQDTAREFQIGHAPEAWDATLQWGLARGFNEALLEQAGLAVRRDNGGFYDRFRGRLMFPIRAESGQVVAFSGRVLDPNAKEAKYINSPETPVFTKGRVLFGLDKHKRDLLDTRQAIVCEGQLDLITCHQAGLRNMVAPQGTAFTPNQARILRRYVDEVVLCFDSDAAGRLAVVRSMPALLAEGLPVRVLTLPDNPDGSKNDPDSFVKGPGIDAFRALAAAAPDFWTHHLAALAESQDPATERGRFAIRREVFPLLREVRDASTRERVLLMLAARLGTSPATLKADFQRETPRAPRPGAQTQDAPAQPGAQPPTPPAKPDPVLAELIRLAIAVPGLVPEIQRRLDPAWYQPVPGREILDTLFDLHAHDHWHDAGAFVTELPPEWQDSVSALAAAAPPPDPTASLAQLLRQLERLAIQRDIQAREQRLREGPPPELAKSLLTDLVALRRRVETLKSGP